MSISWGHGDVANAAAAPNLLDPTRIALSPASAQVHVGDSAQLVATAYYVDGSSLDVTSLGTWSSADAAIANVTRSGVVSALKIGEVSIGFIYGTSSAKAVIDVLREIAPSGDDDWWWAVIS